VSQANVEIVKRLADAFSGGDLEIIADLVTPDFEWLPAISEAFGGSGYRGREAFEEWVVDIRNAFGEIRPLGEEFRDLGDRVLMLGRIDGQGKGSGVPVGAPLGWVVDFRGEKVSRIRAYLDHAEALRAAGLAE
jgi:ketosteroid isomerase-like protein